MPNKTPEALAQHLPVGQVKDVAHPAHPAQAHLRLVSAPADANPTTIPAAQVAERELNIEIYPRGYDWWRGTSAQLWPAPGNEYSVGLCADLWDEEGLGVQLTGDKLDAAVDSAIAASKEAQHG